MHKRPRNRNRPAAFLRVFLPGITLAVLVLSVSPMKGGTPSAQAYLSRPAEVWVDNDFDATTFGWGVDHFDTIQEGIDAVAANGTVHVADGTYRGQGNKNLDFEGRALTVRSNMGPDRCVIDCEKSGQGFYFHSFERSDSVVSGLTISNGSAMEAGGILCESSSPTITNCVFRDNRSGTLAGFGAAVSLRDASPVITGCTFESNYASGAGHGGAISSMLSSPAISNCVFRDNRSGLLGEGGAIFASDSTYTVTSCVFEGNRACGIGVGGAICNFNSVSTITNCIFRDNDAYQGAGGAIAQFGSSTSITNCSFRHNRGSFANSLWADSALQPTPSQVTLTNCILWDGPEAILGFNGTHLGMSYCNVQDDNPWDDNTWPGVGNIDDDPLWTSDLILDPGSPCIDAGNNRAVPASLTEDIGGNNRITDGDNDGDPVVDMGAREFSVGVLTLQIEGEGSTTPEAGEHEGVCGTSLSISAVPASGWEFHHWSGEVIDPYTPATHTVLSANSRITAHFTPIVHTLTMAYEGEGSLSPESGHHLYPQGSSVNITATPPSGWIFDRWSGKVANRTLSSTSVIVAADRTITAYFSRLRPTLTMRLEGQGSVTPPHGPHDYVYGTSVKITAQPAVGWRFEKWSGPVSEPNSANATVKLESNEIVTAHFTPAFANPSTEATDDETLVSRDTPITIDILHNDVVGDRESVTVAVVTDPSNGTIILNSDNTLSYTPDPGFSGVDSFTYAVSDSQGSSDTANVTLVVEEVRAGHVEDLLSRPWIWIVVGSAVLIGLAALGFLLVRRASAS